MKTSTKIWMCLGGCALVVLGVLCIANPGSTILSLAWALGLMLLIAGFSTIGVWSTMRDEDPYSGLTFLGALLQIFLGTWMVINPAPLAVALPFIFAFWVLFEGVKVVVDSFNFKEFGFKKWWLLCLFGVLIVCAGCYGLFYNPAASAATIAWLVGLGIILDGVSYWVRVAAVNRVQNKMHRIADHIRKVVDIVDVEEVK